MKCCKKAARAKEKNRTEKPFFCSLTMCSEMVPSAPTTSASQQISAVFVPSELAGIFHTLQLTRPKESVTIKSVPERMSPAQPIYIAYNSLLV